MESEPISFTYLPHNPDPYEVKRKRKIKSDINFRDKPCMTAESAPPAEQPFHFPQPQTMSPDEQLCAAQHGNSTLGEMCIETQDSNNSAEMVAMVNELLEMPAFVKILSDPSFSLSMPTGFEQLPDSSSSFTNMDMNFNQNFGTYPQDFTQYNDLRFNMLVNENLTPQSEAQDSPSDMAEVKTEKDHEDGTVRSM